MKNTSFRVLSLALSLILALSCVVSAAAFEGRYGDVDGSSKVDSTDALAILLHAVEKKTLTGDALLRADVNADTYVNSSDALEVLLFTVGKRDKFTAETIAPPEASEKEILGLFSTAVGKMYEIAPYYILKNTMETVDLKTSVALSAELQESLKEQMAEKTVNKFVYPLGSNSSKKNLPASFSVDDISKFKSVDYKKLDTGEYELIIRFNDEVNPTKDSYLVKNFGFSDAATFKASLEKEFADLSEALPGAKCTPGDVKYQNVYVSCVFNPDTNEFVSYDFSYEASVKVKFTFLFVSADLEMVTRTTNNYTDFSYVEEAE